MRRARGFTILEILLVVAIIALLASLLMAALGPIQNKVKVARARTELATIRLGLASYEHDVGRLPRRPGAVNAVTIWRNDAAWLYAALRNRPVAATGGGPSSPYLDWKPENVGFVPFPDPYEGDDATTAKPPFVERALESENFDALNDAAFQRLHAPAASPATCLAFLDPWGNPYFYREWASVPEAVKAGASRTRTTRTDDHGGTTVTADRPREPHACDAWSFGPNGMNEWGGGDDVR